MTKTVITISNPGLYVNNEKVAYKKFTPTPGIGAIKTSVETLGAGEVRINHARDDSTRKGKMSFSTGFTSDLQEKYKTWVSLPAGNIVSMIDEASSTRMALRKASVSNTPDFDIAPDSEIKFEFEGEPMEI